MIQAGFEVVSHLDSQAIHFFSHCGGGTGAEGWSVSPGRVLLGSVGMKKKKNTENTNNLEAPASTI